MGGRGGAGPAGGPTAPAASAFNFQQAFERRVAETLESMRLSRNDIRRDPDTALFHVADLRDNMSDVPRDLFDRALTQMITSRGKLAAMPQSNQKILTPRQREGAITLGNESKHLIRLLPGGRDLVR